PAKPELASEFGTLRGTLKMTCYFDSSALVKYYVTEPGSAWVRQQVDGEDDLVLAEITITEVAAALGMLHRMGRISPSQRLSFWERFERDCAERYNLTPVVHEVIWTAASLCSRYPLRAYDAVQLASGLALRAPLAGQGTPVVFVSADEALVSAARFERLAVDNPFWHTDMDVRRAP
ncbi:MAG: type II toxin-antitoxin system VapC family toxin, partial [Dehalococcoidia bacterium]|nr:type II toxin-antitoxin system VapC family toxin [Dehalococcoidia bacterium]